MANILKKQLTDTLLSQISIKPNFILVDYGSIAHQPLEKVRKALVEVNARIKIVKNSILKVVINRLNRTHKLFSKEDENSILHNSLVGRTALISLDSDWAVVLSKFLKLSKENEGLFFKVGFIDNTLYFKQKLDTLASLPSKEVLIGKLLYSIKSPQYKLVYSMKAETGRFVRVLKQLKNNTN